MNIGIMSRHVSNRTAIAIVTFVFFMFGFLTVMNDILIPHLKSIFHMNYAMTTLVQFMFFLAYLVMSIPSGKVVSIYGYRKAIIFGLFLAGLGCFLFYPAASWFSYRLFLFAFFVLATGLTMLQVAANPYISLLGPAQTASSRLNLAQGFNSLGTMIAGPLGGMLILSTTVVSASSFAHLTSEQQQAYRLQQAHAVQGPYIAFAFILFLLAFIVYLFHLPESFVNENSLDSSESNLLKDQHTLWDALKHKHLLLGVIGIFLYVGAEVSIGSFMVNFISSPDIGHISQSVAARYLSVYWGGAMVGRFLGSAILQKLSPRRLLGIFASVASLLVLLTILSTGHVAMWLILFVGFFNFIQFPNIFTLGIEGMGELTGKASSLLIMAIVGGAVIPLLQGVLADHIGIHYSYILCFAMCTSFTMDLKVRSYIFIPHFESI